MTSEEKAREQFAKLNSVHELSELLDTHAAEQRQMCADAVDIECRRWSDMGRKDTLNGIDACLNATGESDE